MKQSLPTTFFYTLLLVLVNPIQSCGSNHNIELKEPTSIAPEGEAIPTNNSTPSNAERNKQHLPTLKRVRSMLMAQHSSKN
jgi:hypothetical protein